MNFIVAVNVEENEFFIGLENDMPSGALTLKNFRIDGLWNWIYTNYMWNSFEI